MLDTMLSDWLKTPGDSASRMKILGPGSGPALDRGIASRFAVYWPVLGLVVLSIRELF